MDGSVVRDARITCPLTRGKREGIVRDLALHPDELLAETLTALLERGVRVEQESLIDRLAVFPMLSAPGLDVRILVNYPTMADDLQILRAILETIPGERFRFPLADREAGDPPDAAPSGRLPGIPAPAEGGA